jgi:arylsulfatase A-like enzyme/Tfp pilus assembly protein PilF
MIHRDPDRLHVRDLVRFLRRLASAAAVILGLSLLGCGSQTELPPEPGGFEVSWLEEVPRGPWNVLLLTLDTTRDDALGCYGRDDAGTPTLDSLALAGVLFEDVATSAPMTCPAHATILTGLDPHEHGIRDNGRFVASDTLVTLAEMFRDRGYRTAAFLAAFPLDSRFGLDQGFDLYDDAFTERAVARSEETGQRRADAVTDDAVQWMREHRGGAFFLWVHYFDPHFPYDAPEPYGSSYPESPYQAEVAFMDAEIGRLLRELRAMGVMDSTFILAVGDHGEALGEHGEESHSYFIYDETQMVPCLLVPPSAWPDAASLEGLRIPWHARLRDMTATVANLMGWTKSHWQRIGTTSLLPELTSDQPPVFVSYLETLTPYLEYGWSDLRGVRTRDWKYIRAPKPELYDLTKDPAETVNVVGKHPEAVARLEGWLDWYLAGESEDAQKPAELDQETIERLRSLGYVAGDGAPGEGSGADPKDRLDAYKAIMQARTYAAEYQAEEAIALLEPVIRKEADNLELLRILASTYALARDLEKSHDLYDRILKKAPTEPRFLKESAQVALLAGDHERAMSLLDVLEAASPDEEGVWILRGEVWEAEEELGQAMEAYEEEIERFPGSFEAHSRMGRVLRFRDDAQGARDAFEKALQLFPNHAPSLAALASLAFEDDETVRGDSLLALALQADPFDPEANFRRGWRARQQHDLLTARQSYERAVRVNPEYAQAHSNLGNVYLDMGQTQLALRGYENALALDYETASLRTNQGVAFAQLGQFDKAVESWERALQLGPDESTAQGLIRNINMARQRIGVR